MWKIMKEHLKPPERAKEVMLRVKANFQGRKFRNVGWIDNGVVESYAEVKVK